MALALDTLSTYACAVILLLFACGCISTNARLSESQKLELLEVHNYYRSRVQPTAANMERMVIAICSLVPSSTAQHLLHVGKTPARVFSTFKKCWAGMHAVEPGNEVNNCS